MGNWWKGVSDARLRECEKALLQVNGIPDADCRIRDVPLDDSADSQNFVHEIRVKGARDGLPNMVLIHGYLSGGAQFAKMMGHLRNHFNLYAIDMVGFGCSGRP